MQTRTTDNCQMPQRNMFVMMRVDAAKQDCNGKLSGDSLRFKLEIYIFSFYGKASNIDAPSWPGSVWVKHLIPRLQNHDTQWSELCLICNHWILCRTCKLYQSCASSAFKDWLRCIKASVAAFYLSSPKLSITMCNSDSCTMAENEWGMCQH